MLELLRSTLLRERSYWAKVLEKYGMPEAYWEGFAQTVAAITLIGGVQSDSRAMDVINLLPKTKAYSSQEKQQIRLALSQFFQKGCGLDALRPDRLGEVLILEEYEKDQSLVDDLNNLALTREERLTMLSILERVSVRYTYANKDTTQRSLNYHKDLLFRNLRPLIARKLDKAIKRFKINTNALDLIAQRISTRFHECGMEPFIENTELTAFDVYNKMKTHKLSFAQIFALFTITITVANIDECYRGLGIIHNLFKPIPGMFIDYIGTPSASGYSALHTTVIGPYGVPLSIRIFSTAMRNLSRKLPLTSIPLE